MADDTSIEERDLAAGDFSSWIAEMQGALRGERESDVPCGGCTACCTASQFIHIGPDEIDTLAHIPGELLFPAPRMPRGHLLLGYDERGQCPMLVDDQCSVYDHRPRTCRTYDCRIFPAAGIEIDDEEKVLIARRARRWLFSFPTRLDAAQHEAVRAAATFVRGYGDLLPDGAAPANSTQLAVLAVELHEAFLGHDEETGEPRFVDPGVDTVRVELMRRTAAREAK